MHTHALHTCRTCPSHICNRRKMNNYHHLRKPRIHVEHITTQLTYSVPLVTYAKTVLLRETRRTILLLCLSCLTEYTHGEHALYMRHGCFPPNSHQPSPAGMRKHIYPWCRTKVTGALRVLLHSLSFLNSIKWDFLTGAFIQLRNAYKP
jgi:hypothetical protein